MHYRTLGSTGLEVSEVGFGAWAIGGPAKLGDREIGWGEVDDDVSVRALEAAFEAGINFFDTADAYGNGHSEEVIGKTFTGRREQVIIASKVGNRTLSDGRWVKQFTKVWIHEAIDASLRRLRTDYLDLYQLHTGAEMSDYRDEAFEALEEIRDAGKIRHHGVSVGPPAHGVALISGNKTAAIQVVYNILAREPEGALLPLAQQAGVGIIARVPLASGFLTGKFDEQTRFPANDHRSHKYSAEQIRSLVSRVRELEFLTDGGRRTLAQAAIQYCLAQPGVSTVIPGAKTPEQARDNALASDGTGLTQEEVERVRDAVPYDPSDFALPKRR